MQQDNPVTNVPPLETETMVSMPPQAAPSTLPPVVSTPEKPKIPNVVFVLLIIVISLIIGASIFFIFIKMKTPTPVTSAVKTQTTTAVTPQRVTPTATPITQNNVDQTITNTDSTVSASIDQANTDLNQVNSINTNQDSTNGL